MPAIAGWFDHELAQEIKRRNLVLSTIRLPGTSHSTDPRFAATTELEFLRYLISPSKPSRPLWAIHATGTCALSVPPTWPGWQGKRDGPVVGCNHLRGRFAIVRIDLEQGRATLVTDRFAAFPLCFSDRGAENCFFRSSRRRCASRSTRDRPAGDLQLRLLSRHPRAAHDFSRSSANRGGQQAVVWRRRGAIDLNLAAHVMQRRTNFNIKT